MGGMDMAAWGGPAARSGSGHVFSFWTRRVARDWSNYFVLRRWVHPYRGHSLEHARRGDTSPLGHWTARGGGLSGGHPGPSTPEQLQTR